MSIPNIGHSVHQLRQKFSHSVGLLIRDALPAAVAGLEAAGVTVRHHTCPGLGHGLDDDGIRLGMAFLTDIFGVDLAALEAEPGDG